MDLKSDHRNYCLASALLNTSLTNESPVGLSPPERMFKEVSSCPDHRSSISESPKNLSGSIYRAFDGGQSEGSQEIMSKCSLSQQNARNIFEENQRCRETMKDQPLNRIDNGSLRATIEVEEPFKSITSDWMFDINESHYSSETIFFFKSDTEQHADDLSGYREFKTPKDRSITLMKYEIECEEKIEEEDPIIKSEGINDGLIRKLEEDQYAMIKEEEADFNQSMMINPFLESLANLIRESQQTLDLSGRIPQKSRVGKCAEKRPQEVGRHFLKVHLKKCFNHALFNSMEVYDALKNIYADNQSEILRALRQPMQSFLFDKLKEFNEWLENLKRTLRDYSKDDFKAAYLVNHKELQCEILNLEQEDIPVFISNKSNQWDIIIFKMALRLVSLKFIHDTSERGLRFQLKNANNITIEEEHQRYVVLTEWLIEKATRIDYSEVFGKRWVAHFFEAREKRNKDMF